MIQPSNRRIYPARNAAGRRVGRYRLRAAYAGLVEFMRFSDVYGLASRLGYRSAEAAWRANPVIECSSNPADFRRVHP